MRHRKFLTAGIFLIPSLFTLGCGSSPQAIKPNTVAAHGGTLLPLEGGKGLVEFVVESVGAASSKSKKSLVVAYFLKEDSSGPLEPGPSDVSFTPEHGQSITLKPEASGRFASEPGVAIAAGRDIAGELSVKLGGEAIKVAILAR